MYAIKPRFIVRAVGDVLLGVQYAAFDTVLEVPMFPYYDELGAAQKFTSLLNMLRNR